jgi:hypothetical protein
MKFKLRKMFRVLFIAVLGVFSSVSLRAQVNTCESVQPAADTPSVALNTPEPSTSTPKAAAPAVPARQAEQPPSSPLQFKIGDASVTPVGFMDLTNTWRSTNAGTSLQTNFGSIPYFNTLQGHLAEDKFSAANSRIGFRVDAVAKGFNILGYFEGDFVGGVGNGANNTQVSSNSLLFRIRLYWADLRKGPFEMLAGQSWSMMTPNRTQISALPGNLFFSQVIDVNYLNGLTWGRIPGIRFLYHPTEKATIGLSLENSTQYFGGSGGGGTPTLPAGLATTIPSEVDAGAINGIATPNVHPDVIFKLALDPNSHVHVEGGGVERTVKLYNPTTNTYFTKGSGGGFINGNFEIFKNFRLISNNYWSDGGGRYIFGLAPDFIVHADGSPSFIHSGSTIQGFETRFSNTQLYGYWGGVYIQRNTALDTNGAKIGYGYAGSPNSQNKTTEEGTTGIIQTFFNDGKYGGVQLMLQYAYFFRNPWSVAPGTPRNTHEHAVWFNLRYVLPGSAPTVVLQK